MCAESRYSSRRAMRPSFTVQTRAFIRIRSVADKGGRQGHAARECFPFTGRFAAARSGLTAAGHPLRFLTPEYAAFDDIVMQKWETCRGISSSFGYNRDDDEESYLSADEAIRLLIDIVSKNGNLLLNVGPCADGSIHELQRRCLLELGAWLEGKDRKSVV